jgi:3-dehydroquinate dehydratase-1
MICVSVYEPDFEKCMSLIGRYDFTEIRLDGTDYSEEQVRKLFAAAGKSIATFRPGDVSEEIRENTLVTAISAGADFVDVEVDASRGFRERILHKAREHECAIIISYHNLDRIPDEATLEKIMEQCFECGADIAKIACRVTTGIECARILSLYKSAYARERKLIAVGIGDMGKITRVAAPLLGAPFTYASAVPGRNTAPGQIDYRTLKSILEHVT